MSIIDTFIRWGRDRGLNDPPNGYPGCSVYAKDHHTPGDQADRLALMDPLDDDPHCGFDRVVSQLRMENPESYKVVIHRYLQRKVPSVIAKEMTRQGHQYNTRDIERMLEFAHNWVESRLEETV